jgi:hypothetical protein
MIEHRRETRLTPITSQVTKPAITYTPKSKPKKMTVKKPSCQKANFKEIRAT